MEPLTDCDGKPYVYGDRMSVRQYYSHGGPGWDVRHGHPKYDYRTDKVEDDSPYEPKRKKEDIVFNLVEDSPVVMLTFGGKQMYTMKKGDRFIAGFVLISNEHYTIFQNGLNYYVFVTLSIPPEVAGEAVNEVDNPKVTTTPGAESSSIPMGTPT